MTKHNLGKLLSFISGITLVIQLCSGCANIVPPSGGEKDLTEPKLLSISPKDSLLNKNVYKINLHFNKFMEVHNLDKNLFTSPLLQTDPTVTAIGKSVEIKLPDSSLKANTTYRIVLGNSLTDNREQTPYKNFTYTFSTGNYFDSLRLIGQVWDAASGLPDSAATIFLYPATKSDTAVFRERPDYVRKVNSDGRFEFEGLPDQAFKAFAVTDADHNYIFAPGQEKIDFLEQSVRPKAHPDSSLNFHVFQETATTDSNKKASTSQEPGKNRFANKNKAQSQAEYRVLVDTLNKRGTFDLAEPLRIELFSKVQSIDSSRIYLSYEDKDIEVEAIHTLTTDSSGIALHTNWLADKSYTLRLIKGWAKDSSNKELLPGKYTFRTRSLDDYATLNIQMDSSYTGAQYLLMLESEGKSIWIKPVLKKHISIPLLKPGTYTLRLIVDTNENGKWDTGDLLAHKHAERVIPYPGNIMLKAGWINDVDFKRTEPGTEEKESRFSKNSSGGQQEKPTEKPSR